MPEPRRPLGSRGDRLTGARHGRRAGVAERTSEVQALTSHLGDFTQLLNRGDHSEIIDNQRQQGGKAIEAVKAVLAGNTLHPMSPEEILAAMPEKFGLTPADLRKRITMRVERGLHCAKADGGMFRLSDANGSGLVGN
jgi:hypothetical protein